MPLWKCPRCGAKLVTKNGSHSCVRTTVRAFFADKSSEGVRWAKTFIAETRKIGPVTLHPVKTRIALMVDVRFAAINRIGADGIRGHLWLKAAHPTKRFLRIERLGREYLYHFELGAKRPMDAELRRFLRMSYAVGRRAGRPRPRLSGRRASSSRSR